MKNIDLVMMSLCIGLAVSAFAAGVILPGIFFVLVAAGILFFCVFSNE